MLIEDKTPEKRRFAILAQLTGIHEGALRTWWNRGSLPTGTMLEGIAKAWPEHAFWLATGIADEDGGHNPAGTAGGRVAGLVAAKNNDFKEHEDINPLNILQAALQAPAPPTTDELGALRRLIQIAKADTGQSRRVADFLLAWWNAGNCGAFDLTNLWALDRAIVDDMQAVFGLIGRVGGYPDKIHESFNADFRAIVRAWRPELED